MSGAGTRPVAPPNAEPKKAPPFGAALASIIGRRAEQQDAGRLVAVELSGGRPALLMIVADGMGGHAGGAEASRIAIEVFERTFTASAGVATARRLHEALSAANAAIGQRAKADSDLRGMGCTLVAAALDGRRLTWISVGDTLLVAAKAGRLRRLNADHSLAAILDERAERGEITVEEALASPQRHMLRAAVTGDRIALIDENSVSLDPGDLLVAATDGVLTLPWQRFATLLSDAGTPAAVVRSVLQAVSRDMPDDQDNTTLAAVRVSSRASIAPATRTPLRRSWRTLVAVLAFLVALASIAVLALVIWQDGDASSPAPKTSTVPTPVNPAEPARLPATGDPEGSNSGTDVTSGPGPASGRAHEPPKPTTSRPVTKVQSAPGPAKPKPAPKARESSTPVPAGQGASPTAKPTTPTATATPPQLPPAPPTAPPTAYSGNEIDRIAPGPEVPARTETSPSTDTHPS